MRMVSRTRLVAGIVLSVAIALTQLVCQSQTDTASEPSGPVVDSVASVDGVMIQYEMAGVGNPALVFVHGWSCDRSYWKQQIEEFSKTNKVVAIDMGGHGGSGLNREDWTVSAFGADVAAVVDALGLDSVILIGHSMAGGVNIEAARLLPDRVIALIGADTYQDVETTYTPEQVAGFVAPFKADFAATMDGFVRGMFPPTADSALVDRIAADMASAPPEVAVSAFENYISGNTMEMLEHISVPIRAVNADIWPTNIEANRKYMESFEVKIIPGCGHFVMQEKPAEFNRLLRETVGELTGRTAPVESES